jgi:hypothetical protein
LLNTDPGTIVIWLGGAIVVWLSLELLLCAMIVATAPSKWNWRHTIYGSTMIALGFGRPLAAVPQQSVEEPLASNERKAD